MDVYKIKTNYSPPNGEEESFSMNLRSIEKLLFSLIPFERNNPDFFSHFNSQIPLITKSSLNKPDTSVFSISSIIPAKLTLGANSYLSETFSRWLVPGKQLPIVKSNFIVFLFKYDPKIPYFLHQIYLKISSENEIPIILKQFPLLANQIKINISVVRHARSVVASRSLSTVEKNALINTNIDSLINPNSLSPKTSIFEDINQIIKPFSAEEKTKEIYKTLHWLAENKPLIFERDLFTELNRLLVLLSDNFIADRGHKRITKILSYIYLFRKFLLQIRKEKPGTRHITIKVFNFSDTKKHSGILVCLNFLNKNELFDEKHLLKSIQKIIPSYEIVKDSFFTDTQEKHLVKTLYIEIDYSGSSQSISLTINLLRRRLLQEVKNNIQILYNSLFNPQNEEEIFKNTVVLSKQLRYVNDRPQIMIHFHAQYDHSISFYILLARIIKKDTPSLGDLLKHLPNSIEIQRHKKKKLGAVRKKYPKEFHFFELIIPKKEFVRDDFALDIIQARSYVYKNISLCLGKIRDYNGSTIHQKTEIIELIKKELREKNLINEPLIECFFYNMEPHYMSQIIPIKLIQHALITIHNLIHGITIEKIHIQKHIESDYMILFILHPIVKKTPIKFGQSFTSQFSSILAYSSFALYETQINCFIFSDYKLEETQKLEDAVYKAYA